MAILSNCNLIKRWAYWPTGWFLTKDAVFRLFVLFGWSYILFWDVLKYGIHRKIDGYNINNIFNLYFILFEKLIHFFNNFMWKVN